MILIQKQAPSYVSVKLCLFMNRVEYFSVNIIDVALHIEVLRVQLDMFFIH